MSSNNQLIILKEKKFRYGIWMNHCVDNEFDKKTATRLAFATTLEKAIKFANKYCREELVEYGYHIDDSCLN